MDLVLALLHSTESTKPRWEKSENALRKLVHGGIVYTPESIVAAVEELADIKQGTSEGLTAFLREETNACQTVKKIGMFALEAPEMFPTTASAPSTVRLLTEGSSHTVQLSQRQITCLVALGFFRLVPAASNATKLRNAGCLTFDRWFHDNSAREQLRCLFGYFDKRSAQFQPGTNNTGRMMTVSRKRAPKLSIEDWQQRRSPLLALAVHSNADDRIEHAGGGQIEIDFANAAIGGGVLGGGKAQEEIRFLICPDLFACIVLCEHMDPTEAIEVCGVEQCSQYVGYGRSFRYKSDLGQRESLCTAFGSRVVAIDAAPCIGDSQYSVDLLLRELTKAHAGFMSSDADVQEDGEAKTMAAVATGNWGCGVFGGDVHFKSLIQWAAASFVGRSVNYYPFCSHVGLDLPVVVRKFMGSSYNTVGDLCNVLSKYNLHHRTGTHRELASPDLSYADASIDIDTVRHETVFEFVLRSLATEMASCAGTPVLEEPLVSTQRQYRCMVQ